MGFNFTEIPTRNAPETARNRRTGSVWADVPVKPEKNLAAKPLNP